ncbi:hypothetical protein K435DRAFT_966870 [Dendrothele bispora CBS 962.96]|uniref:Uncharacterized protein n=1 Tax=Dendrothele bispora (strain CBS 962.96) TaxID=1314807 RepID=A0A4S8LYM5_DENBC|nr:hypothetical protein K435DRAFT_966870 [Dendrothele bispora CBS 962.96]
MLEKLAEVTRRCLHDVEGDLHVPWATAQQIHAQQKVNYSIDEGFKKYWVNLGMGTIFEGQILWDCVSRIHDDILLVWNFHDPDKILSGNRFCTDMIELIQPLLLQPEPQSDILSHTSDLASIAGNIAETFNRVLSAAGIAALVVKFLYGKYQKIPSTALCLGAYIVDLTLILHNLFMTMLSQEPPRPVSREFIQDTLHNYKTSDASRVHDLVRDIVYGRQALHPEEKIADLIRKELKMEPLQDLIASGVHNERFEVQNREPEASTQVAEIGTDQITNDSTGKSDVNIGGDHSSGVREHEQDRNTGDNDKVGGSISNKNDAEDQGAQHEDSKTFSAERYLTARVHFELITTYTSFGISILVDPFIVPRYCCKDSVPTSWVSYPHIMALSRCDLTRRFYAVDVQQASVLPFLLSTVLRWGILESLKLVGYLFASNLPLHGS